MKDWKLEQAKCMSAIASSSSLTSSCRIPRENPATERCSTVLSFVVAKRLGQHGVLEPKFLALRTKRFAIRHGHGAVPDC